MLTVVFLALSASIVADMGKTQKKGEKTKGKGKGATLPEAEVRHFLSVDSQPFVLTVNREWFGVSCATQVSNGSRNSVEMGNSDGFRISQRGHQFQRWGYQPIIWPFFPKPLRK